MTPILAPNKRVAICSQNGNGVDGWTRIEYKTHKEIRGVIAPDMFNSKPDGTPHVLFKDVYDSNVSEQSIKDGAYLGLKYAIDNPEYKMKIMKIKSSIYL